MMSDVAGTKRQRNGGEEGGILNEKNCKTVSDAEVTPRAHRTYLLSNYLRPLQLAPIEIVSVSVFPSLSLAVSKLMCL